jgi:hypothetical protein
MSSLSPTCTVQPPNCHRGEFALGGVHCAVVPYLANADFSTNSDRSIRLPPPKPLIYMAFPDQHRSFEPTVSHHNADRPRRLRRVFRALVRRSFVYSRPIQRLQAALLLHSTQPSTGKASNAGNRNPYRSSATLRHTWKTHGRVEGSKERTWKPWKG